MDDGTLTKTEEMLDYHSTDTEIMWKIGSRNGMSILVNPEIIPILSGFHSSIIRTRKRPALVLISDTKLLCKNDYKTILAA